MKTGQSLRFLRGGVELAVDNALSLTSENPVQNQVITACINDMNDSLDIVKAHAKATGNVHNLTLSDLGIANVENKSSADIRGELTKENVVDALGYEPNDSTQVDGTTIKYNSDHKLYAPHSHLHSNKTTLDSLSESDGKLMFKGASISEGACGLSIVSSTRPTNQKIGDVWLISNKIDNYILWENTENGTYAFVQSENKWTSNNKGVKSSTATSTWKINVPEDTEYDIKYKVSSEEKYDKFTLTLDGTINIATNISGAGEEITCNASLLAGEHTLVATYVKDSSTDKNEDCAYVRLEPINIFKQGFISQVAIKVAENDDEHDYKYMPIGCNATNVFLADGRTLQEYISNSGSGGGNGSGGSTDTPNIVTFADGTDDELKAMLDAHYQGIIDITDYWSVGDTRNISLDGTNYAFAIIGFNHDDLETPINEKTKAAVSIQMVDLLSTTYKMNDGNTNVGGWESSNLRRTMQSTMIDWFPESFKNIIKNVTKRTSAGNKGGNVNTTIDNLWIPSEIELFGSASYSYSGAKEGSKYVYYLTNSSRIKKKGANSYYWWTRSPRASTTYDFCTVNSDGTTGTQGAGLETGIAIGLCI